jgi:hypothetical protein
MVLSSSSPAASVGSRRPSVISGNRSNESIRSGYVLAGGTDPNESWFHAFVSDYILCGCICAPRYSKASILSEPERQFLIELQVAIARPFDSANPDHEILLSSVWRNTFPGEPLPGLVDVKWTRLGFQSNNPRTDIRTGFHSLEAMEYMSRNYTEEFRRIVHEASDPETEYPFAASCVSIAFSLVVFFKLNSRTSVNPSGSASGNRWAIKQFVRLSMTNKDSFNELFSMVTVRVHKEWMKQVSGEFDIHYFSVAIGKSMDAVAALFNTRRVDDFTSISRD